MAHPKKEKEEGAIPMHTEPAAVLAAVKDKPKRAAPRGSVLDRHCARRPTIVQAGTEEWAAKPNKRMGNGKVKKHRC